MRTRASIPALAMLLVACAGEPARPPAAPAAAELEHTTYTIGGDAPASLLVALHYSSGTPAFWDPLVKDWSAPVRVLLPQGPRPHEEEGFTWFPADHETKDAAGKTADVVAVPMGTRLLGDPTGPWPADHRVRVLQGETDAIIDARATAARVAALAGQGVAIDATTYPGLGHDMSPALIADWRRYLQQALATIGTR